MSALKRIKQEKENDNPLSLVIDWKVPNFVEEHRESSAIKSPELRTAGIRWNLALACGTDPLRKTVAVYVRYAADADWTLKDYEWVKFDLGLEVGSTNSAEKLSADAHIETQVDESTRSTYSVPECVGFHPTDAFWRNIGRYTDPNGDLKVKATVTIFPIGSPREYEAPPPYPGSPDLADSPKTKRTAVSGSGLSPKRSRTTIPRGTTVAVRGMDASSKVQWWLARLEDDLNLSQGTRTKVSVRWWNRIEGKKNAWYLDTANKQDSISHASVHKDGTLFKMEKTVKSRIFKVADLAAFDALYDTYGT
eukprot:m.24797 g.24797  ORF g.24797 m.24797 type:complete len:307 (-) comp6119_c0_seq1:89-1009(-)